MRTSSLRSFLRSVFLTATLGTAVLATPSHARHQSPPVDIGVVKFLAGDAERLPPGLVATFGSGYVADEQIDVAKFETLIVSRDGLFELTRQRGKRDKLKRMLNHSTSLVAIDATPQEIADELGIEVLEMPPNTERYVAASVTLTGVDGSIAGGVLVPAKGWRNATVPAGRACKPITLRPKCPAIRSIYAHHRSAAVIYHLPKQPVSQATPSSDEVSA